MLFLKKRRGVVERKNVCGLINNEHRRIRDDRDGERGVGFAPFLLLPAGSGSHTFVFLFVRGREGWR